MTSPSDSAGYSIHLHRNHTADNAHKTIEQYATAAAASAFFSMDEDDKPRASAAKDVITNHNNSLAALSSSMPILPTRPSFSSSSFGTAGFGAPGIGPPSVGPPGIGPPGVDIPGFGAPGFGIPRFGFTPSNPVSSGHGSFTTYGSLGAGYSHQPYSAYSNPYSSNHALWGGDQPLNNQQQQHRASPWTPLNATLALDGRSRGTQQNAGQSNPPDAQTLGLARMVEAKYTYLTQQRLARRSKKVNNRHRAREQSSKKGAQKAKKGKGAQQSQQVEESRPDAIEVGVSSTLRCTWSGKISQQNQKSKDPKIMLGPPPDPSIAYLLQALGQAYVIDPPRPMLVVLDLNGTVLYRPSRKYPTKFTSRPYLQEFLKFLFLNFYVMVWSSARPENVSGMVEAALNADMRQELAGVWGRDRFGLSARHYNMNVQIYKDLTRIWSKQDELNIPAHIRFDQRNTILIDDSKLKASAQPHNLLEVPEFSATPPQMQSDFLKEVAGYLVTARWQADVSTFMAKTPFQADGTWGYEWGMTKLTELDNMDMNVDTDVECQ